MEKLYELQIQSVIIEGGASILNQFITANIWDEARIFTSKAIWEKGLRAPIIKGDILEELAVGNDELTIYKPYSKE